MPESGHGFAVYPDETEIVMVGTFAARHDRAEHLAPRYGKRRGRFLACHGMAYEAAHLLGERPEARGFPRVSFLTVPTSGAFVVMVR